MLDKNTRIKANRKRSKILSMLKKKNIELLTEVRRYQRQQKLKPIENTLSNLLIKNIGGCSSYTLYADNGYDLELLTNFSCNHKLCNICNWQRQKKIRRKYFKWFENNAQLVSISKGLTSKIITKTQMDKYVLKGYQIDSENLQYDLMHLTLTVPHSEKGFKGKRFYFKEIVKAYNFMRKTKEFRNFVYGGEYGVETTKNDEGYHIHIHSLLFVKKIAKNRNLLHRDILKIWNRLTVNPDSKRNEFSDIEIQSIKKGNKLLDNEFVKKLDPKGATLINLETIYYKDAAGKKQYVSDKNTESMLRAVMETISYHFKPKLFNSGEHHYDVEAIVELLPEVYKNRNLYSKFGCLFGEKQLNVDDDSLMQDYEEISEDIVDTETGELFPRKFIITNPMNIYAGKDDKISLRRGAITRTLNANSGRQAIEIMMSRYSTEQQISDKNI